MKSSERYRLGFPGQLDASLKSYKNTLFIYELKQPVDGPVLERAVNKAMDMHPIFQSVLKKGISGFYCERTSVPAVVREVPWGDNVMYGTAEFNYLPWVITYTENRIVFTALHSICDVYGMNEFMRTILRFYLSDKGVVFDSDEGLVAPEDIRRKAADPFKETGIRKAEKSITYKKDIESCSVREDFYHPHVESEESEKQFVMKLADVRRCCDETETSLFAVLCAMACSAYARAAGLDEGYAAAYVAVDPRKLYGVISDQDFSLAPQLRYDIKKLSGKSLMLKSTALRSQLDLFMDKDNLDHKMSIMNMTNGLLRPLIMPAAKKAYSEMLYGNHANLIYSHITKLGMSETMEDQLSSVYLAGHHCPDKLTLLHSVTFKDTIYMNFIENSAGHRIAAAYAEELKENGIPYELNIRPAVGKYWYRRMDWA